MDEISGRCFCGAVSWRNPGGYRWAAICHCSDCRRAASADYVSWLGVVTEELAWSGPRKVFRSSLRAVRSFCCECGTPLSFETDDIPNQTCLYAPSLDDMSLYKPSAHLYWPERAPWVSIVDDLPKHDAGLQVAEKSGAPIFPAP